MLDRIEPRTPHAVSHLATHLSVIGAIVLSYLVAAKVGLHPEVLVNALLAEITELLYQQVI